jgi:hypothetical protein
MKNIGHHIYIHILYVFVLIFSLSPNYANALGERQMISFHPVSGAIVLTEQKKASPLLIADDEWPGVLRAADSFSKDIEQVSGIEPKKYPNASAQNPNAIIVGTLGHSSLIDGLVKKNKINVDAIRGRWEASIVATVNYPLPNIARAIVIAGSDKRGTIFALYTLSEQIGVSPWAWWADVRIPHHDGLYVLPGIHLIPSPAVRYRGIFLNDEAPALSGWTKEKFGGFNHQFYEHVFELILRLRANYLWPAMWGNAFNEDDPLNPKLADEYGIVMGTSHHEPMIRAQQEWKKHGTGAWDYISNSDELKRFWAEGIARNKEFESTITIGMRGDGDMAMSPSINIALLEKIVADQRKIIAANEDPKKHDPQIWALYKEVQKYYEKGMRVPDNVTLLWSDDNWGNLRRLPTPEERHRPGGAGVYYHVDYVGDPRSYKWLNTYSITKIWEQMNLALEYGANRVWILNVGDLKPMEFPIEFFLTMARDPKLWGKDSLDSYTRAWATREFGPEHADDIARLVMLYTKYNSRRKPEQLEPTTYSFSGDSEADRIENEWISLSKDAEKISKLLPENEKASFFELVQYPVEACANLGLMYIAAGRNRMYARQGRASTNFWAQRTEDYFKLDGGLSLKYNTLLNGKWNHIMDQTHIGYVSWFDPIVNTMPMIQKIQIPHTKNLGIYPEFSSKKVWSPSGRFNGYSFIFDPANRQTRKIEVAPLGTVQANVSIASSEPWVKLSSTNKTIYEDTSIQVSIDWGHIPQLPAEATVTVRANEQPPLPIKIQVQALPQNTHGFVENTGIVTIDAEHFSDSESDGKISWEKIPGFGLTLSGMESFPVNASSTLPEQPQACISYDFTTLTSGERTLQAILAPTLAFQPGHGLRYSVKIDQEPMHMIDAWGKYSDAEWSQVVSDGVHNVLTSLGNLPAGPHTIHFCRVDAGVVLERLLIFNTQPQEYLGPLESVKIEGKAR